MMSFFRRGLSSWMAVGLLALIMIAFIVTGVGTPGGGLTGGVAADTVATIGDTRLSATEISSRIDSQLRQARQQQPQITAPELVAGAGGIDRIVDQMVGAKLLVAWAKQHGIVASEKLVGGEIGSVPAFQGPTGKFDQAQMQQVLGAQRLSYAQLHDGVAEDLIRRQLIAPLGLGARVPAGIARSYATLLIDRRDGSIGMVPIKPDGIAQPTDAEIAASYQKNIARYSLPERRVIDYAPIGPETVPSAAPTDAEITAAYQADAAKYAGGETRTVAQVVLPNEAAAKALAAKVAGGVTFAAAAQQAGFPPADTALGSVTRDALAKTAGAPVAAAAFALPAGGTSAPIKTDLGWAVTHVDAVKTIAPRPLASVRDEITAALAKKKSAEAVTALVEAVQDALDKGGSFADVAKQNKLAVVTSPPVLATGAVPNDPAYRADPTLTPLLRAAFDAAPDDEPTVETVSPDQHFALMAVRTIVPAAPVPLAQVRPRVAKDIVAQRANDRARTTAQAILAKVNGGTPAAVAFAAAGFPPPRPTGATQLDLMRLGQSGQQIPPPLRALFQLAPGKSQLVALPGAGWFVVRLDRIVPGNQSLLPSMTSAMQGELTRSVGDEYVEQFANAARADVKLTRNPTAIQALARQFSGAAQ